MKEMKRILALVLCFVMLVGMMPAIVLNADAAGTLIDAAIFCSDVHGNPSTVTSVFNGIKKADSTFNPTTASFVGDTDGSTSTVTSNAQSVFSGVQCIYAYGSHDSGYVTDFTGLSYGSSSTNYYIYTISQSSMESSSPDTSDFTTTVSGLDKTKPLFIISHMPLHQRRNDNNGAAAWYEAISAAAESMDIFFFWAHNHTSEGSADTAAYYVAKNGSETISIQGGSTVTPNFTYANAGYINPPNTPARNNVATAVRIYDDSVNLTVYNASGELSGTYAVNETVTRQFAGTTDSGNGGSTDESTPATTDPTEGEEEHTTVTYNYTATAATDGTGYILVSNGYALQNNDGAMSAVAVTVSDDGSTITFADTVDVSTLLWTIDSDGKMMNGDYYFLRTSGSGSYITYISTECASDSKFYSWTYADDTLTCASTSSIYYAYYNTDEGAFWTSQGTSQELKFYVPSGTVSGGGSTEGGDSGDSGDSGNTGGSTETVVGTGTYTTADDGSYQTVTFGTEGEQKTVYVLVDTPTAGKNYIIASGNSAGTVYALKENTTTGTSVTVNAATGSITAPYIENSDNAIVWTASSGMNFKSVNSGYYLNYSSSQGGYKLSFSRSSASDWSADTNALYREGKQNDYYLRCNNGTWAMGSSNSTYNVYFYEEQTIDTSSSVTYSVTASDIEHFYTADETDTETAKITASVTEGAPEGTYSYEILSDKDSIISGDIASNGTITFSGAEGTAQVKVSYSWTEGEGDEAVTYTIWQVIDVTATSPYYTLDLHKAKSTVEEVTGLTAFEEGKAYYILNEDGTYTLVDTTTTPDANVTYYQVTYTVDDEITAPIAIKGIEAGDKYGVWAVVKYYDGTTESGTDMGAVGDAITWSSSDTSIATIDPDTGVITFTGKEGTVNITATYQGGNKPSDTITISVTPSQYTIPSDGTTDFPEYPNEGAIRYDKTATAVGNFSETGIAQLELSMTGVPYTTGSEIDVVLMLDITGSMTDVEISSYTYSKYARVEYTILASQAFVESIVVNEDGSYNGNRVGVYSFNSGGTYTLFDLGAISSDAELTAAKAAIATLYDDYKSGGTPYDDGLSKVQSVLSTAKTDGTGNNRQQYAVFMTDGVPTDYEYITGTTHANYSEASDIAAMLTSSDNYQTRDTDYKYEYYSTEMKDDGVTVYTVGIGLKNTNSAWSGTATQCLNLASRLLNDISGPAGETTQPDAVGTSTLSKQGSYFFSVDDSDAATEMENVFTNIAMSILQAATDVTVEDKIADEYTMIFDIPTGTQNITGVTNDFYIEFVKYTLDSTTHERVDSDSDGDTYDDATSVTKLYVKNTDGVLSAAKDSTGTAYDAPVFEQKLIGDKGTLYYWTTDSSYASKAAVTYTNSDDTYYFIPYGMEQNEDGTAPDGWYNMTSGGYAYGTIENYGTEDSTNMSDDLVIATPYFVYNADTRMIYWTVDKLENATTEYALRYFLYLDNSATEVGEDAEVDPGSYLTNDYAYITYTNFKGNGCRQEFPKPQLTWSGAQVSYVFYLVNAKGEPINKSGQVVDFANATFVTDIYTENTVWNKGADGQITADSQLGIEWLAKELLPADYKVYDEAAYYKLHVYGNHDGTSNFDYFVINGNDADTISDSLNERLTNVNTTASTVSLTTTKVYNTKAGTKITGYGTYASEEADGVDKVLSNFDFYNTTVAFAVVWQPSLAPDTIVVDYGLDVLINVTFNDLMQDNTISGIGLGRDAYGSIVENTGISTTSKLGAAALTTSDGSTISIEPAADDQTTQIRFSQNDMTFDAPVTFYYESEVEYYENSEMETGYLHTSVTVIPATTIYYEDEYVTLTTHTRQENGTYVEAPGWNLNSTAATATQAQDRPGTTSITGVLDADNNYGYDAAYSAMSTYSMNSAAKITVSDGIEGQANFDFYGTGFDVISLTDTTTGTITVRVYEYNEDGSLASKPLHSYVVDTYYGYKQDENGDWVTTDSNDPNALYQVPVMKISDLEYGKYRARIVVFYDEFFDNVGDDSSYDFYLDAIRIYDPTGNKNDVANDAYVKDGEGWPTYEEVRNYVIDQSTGENLGDEAVTGVVFIDGDKANKNVASYTSYGPNNELYLAPGQAIAFELNATAAAGEVAKVQMALKTVSGTASVKVYATDGTNGLDTDIATATDMYYDISNLNGKTVVIVNDGSSGVLSITNVKVTYTAAQPEASEPAPAMFLLRRASVDDALATLNVEEEVPETTVPEETEPETTVPETTEPETTVPEETEPETTVPEETESETTGPQETEPETTAPEETEPSQQEQAEQVIRKVVKIIKGFLDWIFG